MKKTITLWALACLFLTNSYAQSALDCDLNYRLALLYLKGENGIEKDLEKVKSYLTPCVEVEDEKALLLMGRIFMLQEDNESHEKAFRFLKKAARQGNDIAMTDLATLYKYGKGTPQKFTKARSWYKKAYELGNNKAAYSLGYMHLKGFGDLDQNYTKAVRWFERSNYSMAQYWLGVCYYYGYGVPKDLEKASELLGEDFELEEVVVLDDDTQLLYNDILTAYRSYETSFLTKEELKGQWNGHLLKLDWSGSRQEIAVPFHFSLNNVESTWKSNEQEVSASFELAGNIFYPAGISFSIPHISFKETIPNKLTYRFDQIDFYKKQLNGETYLIGKLAASIPVFNEPAAPVLIILKKKPVFSNSDAELSNDMLKALNEQTDQFIKLYPNPMESEVAISYTLDTVSTVRVFIADINGGNQQQIAQINNQQTGTHHYLFNGNSLPSGLYVVTVLVDGERKTRTVIKN